MHLWLLLGRFLSQGKYLSGATGTERGLCLPQPTCATAQYLAEGTTTKRGVCTNQPKCGAGTYLADASSSTAGVCTLHPSCGKDYHLADATALRKGSCKVCRNSRCLEGQVRGGECRGSTNGYTCRTCANTQCEAQQYRTGTCSGTTDGYSCKACDNASCQQDEWRSGRCSGTTNGYSCQKQRTCAAGEFLSGATATRDGICSGCQGDQYMADGKCAPCKDVPNYTCDEGTEYRSGTCAGDKAAYTCKVCANMACTDGQYRSGACTEDTGGYVCTAQPTCAAGQFLANGSPTQKGTCQPRPECPPGEHLTGSTNASPGTCTRCVVQGLSAPSTRPCGPDKYLTGTCGGTVNTLACAPCDNVQCPAEQYRAGTCGTGEGRDNAYECSSCDSISCGASKDWYRTGSCANTTNAYKCERQPICKSNEFLAAASSTRQGICTTCRDGEYLLKGACASCSDTPNFECTGENEYRAGVCAGSSSNYQCKQCDNIDCGASTSQFRYDGFVLSLAGVIFPSL